MRGVHCVIVMLPAGHFLKESLDSDNGEGIGEEGTHLIPPALGL